IEFDENEIFDFDDDETDIGDDVGDGDNDEGALQPWKKLLEIPGRAAWRVSDPHPPDHLMEAMYQILDDGDRTTKQLRRAHRKVLAMHSDLAELRERERRRMVNGSRSSNEPRQQIRKRGFVADYDNEDSNHPVYYGFDETLAMLKHRLIPNYAVTKRVLSECQSLLGGSSATTASKWKPKRIIDYGIGCGSATAAAIDLFGLDEGENTVDWVHGIEPSLPMRECSQRLIEEMVRNHAATSKTGATMAQPPRVTFSNSLSLSQDGEESSSSGGSFDLALFAYTAADLTDVTSCMAAAALLFEKLKPDGIFVMIEPGTPDGFNSIRAVRNMLLDCCPPDDPEFEWDERCHILAPCTHNGSCPMERHKHNFFKQRGKLGHDVLQDEMGDLDFDDFEFDKVPEQRNDNSTKEDAESDFEELSSPLSETDAFNSSFCSFVQHIPGDTTRKGEKFSYLVAQKKKFSEPLDASLEEHDPFVQDNLTDTLAEAFDAAAREDDDAAVAAFQKVQEMRERYLDSEDDELGLELIRGTAKRSSMGRIIRAPIKKKGHVYIDYCAAPGKIIRSRTTKAMSNNVAPGIFGAARKSRWGGFWPDLSLGKNEADDEEDEKKE
ncbi:MAG: hypothetical protein SGILL_004674, partial [Bacillariaceae sp.]